MADGSVSTAPPARPQHHRSASSKSNVLRALVSSKPRPENAASGVSPSKQNVRTGYSVPLLPPDHPHAAKGKVLGERQSNMQSPPSSPSKSKPKRIGTAKTTHDLPTLSRPQSMEKGQLNPKKAKSSTNLAGMFARKDRSVKEASQAGPKDKENTTPPASTSGPAQTPIWAQFATTAKPIPPPSIRDDASPVSLRGEIARYTPQEYSPSKQRNFNGGLDQPQLRPTLASRPTGIVDGNERRRSKDGGRRLSGEQMFEARRRSTDRKSSQSSAEHAPFEAKLTIAKRGGRVLAAVAALQGKGTQQAITPKAESPLDPKSVDEAFEAVLDARNIPEPMRDKMRSLTLRVKADFIKQDQEASKMSTKSRSEYHSAQSTGPRSPVKSRPSSPDRSRATEEEDGKSTKRSRARSRTFTFSKSDKGGDGSPSKKVRSTSKSRAKHDGQSTPSTPTMPRSSTDRRGHAGPAVPSDFISYLRANRDPVTVEVGRLHKLRILLRNETVAWVDTFVSLGGMTEIVGLLHRTMELEWREEHEDQLLHETLLCLKGLCTTERAMAELEKVADTLFPALIGMLFDEEKKGPAEYSTRTIIIAVLFNFLAAATPERLEQRARQILAYMGEPTKPVEARPVDFVLDMHTARPYKLWCREMTHVTKEVFWIFLHHLNVVPLPKAKVLAATYSRRHFPGTRPPVPAAPYIGGVEWDATTYLTAHLDLLNGLIASITTATERNTLRTDLQASGCEKVLGTTLRTCKEKFYAGVHDGLRAWVAAAVEDGWETRFVREGPTMEEQARGWSPTKGSPVKKGKKKDVAPKLELELNLDLGGKKGEGGGGGDDGWLD
ncbi:armadillo-type protein [Neohortaea acidophila]|uniref:Armadillo-type protein n=1 Tax=Neohortaea acidophila TaxID=245834 RepID=A0A6A6PJ10_9PEZI|nr:armadillo-type protein [Neohortaea acidophila]KAF2479247.1 armadillo-type protein [Neohortaea acidophila]